MRGTALLCVFSACAAAQQAGIEGTAIHSVTGQPLSGVHVRLINRSSAGITNVYGALSDSAGHFSITGMEPGLYTMQPEKTGFVYLTRLEGRVPAGALMLKSGQRLTEFKLVMTPRAVITGRVLDEYGDPVANVNVLAEPLSMDAPTAISWVGRQSATNDRGEFRISGAPGKFRIKALPRNFRFEAEVGPDGAASPGYGPTYYPSTANEAQASLVEAVAGSETTGIEVRLVRKARGLTISGVVTGIPEAGRSATVMLQSGETVEEMTGIQGRGVSPDGKFAWTNLEPQFYRIFAQYHSGKVMMRSQKVELKLDGADVTNLELALTSGEDLAGKLEIEGDPPGAAEPRAIRLEPAEISFGGTRSAPVDKDGEFRFTGLAPEKYRVHVDPLPENAYLKTIVVDGAPAAGSLVDLSPGRASSLKITLSRKGAQIAGSVLDKDGDRLVNAPAVVYLMETPADNGPEHNVSVTPEGKYTFKGVRPGKYRLIAIDRLRARSAEEQNPLQKLFAAAEEIQIKESDRISRDVKVKE